MGKLPATLLQFFRVWEPRTPGLRHKRRLRTDDLWQGDPLHALTVPLQKTGGRCAITGRITSRHRGGGEKHAYRLINWGRGQEGAAKHQVIRIEVDPNRSAHVALIKCLRSSRLSYIIAPKGTMPGDILQTGASVPAERGNCLPLSAIPPGSLIHCIGLRPNEGGKIARAAGTYGQLLRTGQSGYAQVKMCSGELRFIPVDAFATIGVVSNPLHKLEILGTAGAARKLGRRPHVRGVAMNPVDHPMGGQGRCRGIPSTSPWGKITKGRFTVKKHLCRFIIKPRPTRNKRKKQPVRNSGKFAVHHDAEAALGMEELLASTEQLSVTEPPKAATSGASS